MGNSTVQHRSGLDYLEAVTALLQRNRKAHETSGSYDAAEMQWWWRTPRSTDEQPQLFWYDETGLPFAAVIATAWDGATSLDPIFMPDASPDWMAQVIGQGLAHIDKLGLGPVEIVADRDDPVIGEILAGYGFLTEDDGADVAASPLSVIEAWLVADKRPGISPLADGYRLASRADTLDRPHHMAERNGSGVEERLRQTSLYRPELDLLTLDTDDNLAATALFWFDPSTNTGLVEPMGTEADHRRRGLARHLLTTGLDLLAGAGAERIKIVFGPSNQAAKDLYLGVGFEPVRETTVFSRG